MAKWMCMKRVRWEIQYTTKVQNKRNANLKSNRFFAAPPTEHRVRDSRLLFKHEPSLPVCVCVCQCMAVYDVSITLNNFRKQIAVKCVKLIIENMALNSAVETFLFCFLHNTCTSTERIQYSIFSNSRCVHNEHLRSLTSVCRCIIGNRHIAAAAAGAAAIATAAAKVRFQFFFVFFVLPINWNRALVAAAAVDCFFFYFILSHSLSPLTVYCRMCRIWSDRW